MELIADLWLPIVLSAVFVFVASSIFHMVVPWHKGDYKKLPNEENALDALRSPDLKPGHYMFPMPASMKDMGSEEMLAKFNQGPVGHMTVLPNGLPNIGKSLVLWFLYSLLIGVFVAYLGKLTIPAGSDFRLVFRITGTIAVLAYALSYIPDSIWKGLKWSVTFKFIFDGVVYGLLTAATFAWLWPEA